VLIAVLFIVSMFRPFFGINVIDRPSSKIDFDLLLKQLHYPPGMLKPPVGPNQMTLEEIRKRAEERKKREEQARLERDKRKKEEEEAARKAEEARKSEEAKKEQEAKDGKTAQTKPSTSFGEINVGPIKEIVGELYQMYQAGQLDLPSDNYSIMASF